MQAVTNYWLQKTSPTVDIFVNIVRLLHQQEEIIFWIRLKIFFGKTVVETSMCFWPNETEL